MFRLQRNRNVRRHRNAGGTEVRPRCAALYCFHLLPCPSLTRRSEFLSVRYLADTIGHTTAAGTYRIKPVALLNTRKCGKQ